MASKTPSFQLISICLNAIYGSIILTSTGATALGSSSIEIENESEIISKTGTPMDNFPDEQRDTFCGTGEAKSTSFVTEYKIPTICTQPLAITVTPNGQIWFVESNVGRIANFDPITESFTEFDNPYWPEGSRSMNWGIDYSSDDSLEHIPSGDAPNILNSGCGINPNSIIFTLFKYS